MDEGDVDVDIEMSQGYGDAAEPEGIA